MEHPINFTYLTLEGHVELEKYKYVYFVFTFSVYILILFSNGVVISVICISKRLHEPMYVFIAALLCNSLVGATALYPKLLRDLLSDSQMVSFEACTFQSYCIYTYGLSEFTLLSAMAYDRYVSVCKPLQYAMLFKMSFVKKILFCCWFVPACENSISLILIYQVKLCRFKLNRIYCNNNAVVKLSCAEASVRSSYGLFILSIALIPPVIFILFSYFRILYVCVKSSKDFTRKALQTCLPHLIIFGSFTVTSCFEVVNSRIELNTPHIFTMIMSVENLVIPPIINPLIYGIKMQEIQRRIKRLCGLIWRRNTNTMLEPKIFSL